jgi:hypothetical protein
MGPSEVRLSNSVNRAAAHECGAREQQLVLDAIGVGQLQGGVG